MQARGMSFKTPSVHGLGSEGQNNVSESCHDAYQLKGNRFKSIMKSHILCLNTHLASGLGQKFRTFFFSDHIMFVGLCNFLAASF